MLSSPSGVSKDGFTTLRRIARGSALVALVGCYRNSAQQAGRPPQELQNATLAVIESDDRGAFWDAEQPRRALDEVREAAAHGSVAVVLFVHGWGHNAATNDQNYRCFSRTVEHLGQRLNSPSFRALMEGSAQKERSHDASVIGAVKVVGIYVGWRGKSLPEAPGPFFILSRAFTFWGRKSAAARVGRGDLRSFIDELGAVYDSTNLVALTAPRADTARLFSLVTIGHSFGGQALFPAVASKLEDQLQRQAGDLAWPMLRDQTVQVARQSLVNGIGDMVILVNPAMEASAYERMYRLGRQMKFSYAQTPALAVFSADNDKPRHYFFPLGRFFSTVLRPTSEAGQRERDVAVLGRHDPQVTHRLEFSRDSATSRDKVAADSFATPLDLRGLGCSLPPRNESSTHDQLYQAILRDPANADVTGDNWINAKHLMPVNSTPQPYAPLMVVRTRSTEIIDGHNGFFTSEFVDFLVRYIMDVEAKRFGTLGARRAIMSGKL